MNPTKERYIILDSLRGLALFGICLANYPEFSLYTFLPHSVAADMPTAEADSVVRFLLYMLVDGKFYTIFSILFGIGFAIILSNAQKKGANGLHIFYRRMGVLALIGLIHLMCLWSGDILLLYALVGMLLPLFLNWRDNRLLVATMVLILLPVVIDGVCTACGVCLSAGATAMQWHYCEHFGITHENFAYWLRDAHDYGAMLEFLVQGAFERMQEFIDGHRVLKVLGLFLLGVYIGRHRMFADLATRRQLLKRTTQLGLLLGIPTSVVYAWSAVCGHPAGLAIHSLLYAVSVVPMALAYTAGVCLLYLAHPTWRLWTILAAPGRMALSNYLAQSVLGILLFYGVGFGLGASIGLLPTEAVATLVFVVEIVVSRVWLRHFQYGLVEWVWRMAVYKKRLPLLGNCYSK